MVCMSSAFQIHTCLGAWIQVNIRLLGTCWKYSIGADIIVMKRAQWRTWQLLRSMSWWCVGYFFLQLPVKNLTLQTCKFCITEKIVVWKWILLSFCKGERIHWYESHKNRCSGPCRPSPLFTTSMVQVDYEIGEEEVWKLFRTSATDWTYNLNTILHWSPYSSEEDLFDQVCVLPLSSLLCLQFSELSSVQSGSMMGLLQWWVYHNVVAI